VTGVIPNETPPLPRPAPAPRATPDIDALRADLAEAFQLEDVEELVGPVAAAALHREQRLPALLAARRAPASQRATATLSRLFLLGDEVRRRDLDAALPRTATRGAVAAGLVRAAGAAAEDPVRAVVDLRPHEVDDAGAAHRWWVASDPTELTTGEQLAPDHVLGIGAASTTLAGITLRRPRGQVLDLGTGCGVQALHATRHSTRVVATDVSARALAFARFNATLAEATIDFRQGSMFEPVAEESFDLIVSNPPFVITPAAAYRAGLPVMSYRDGQGEGDDLVRDLVVSVGRHLRPGGVAQLLGNWEHHRGEEWTDRVGRWLAEAGVDGWIVEREVQDPAEYAETWLRDGGLAPGRATYEDVYAAWLADFAERGVRAVGFGYVTLQRPVEDGAGRWHRIERLTEPARQPLGEHIGLVLDRQAWLRARTDDELAATRFVVAPDVTEERYLRPGAADPEVLLLRQGGGFGRSRQAGTVITATVGACDGELTLHQIIGALATLLDMGEGEVAREVIPAVRDLVLDGFLHPHT